MSISSRITAIEEHIENIYDTLELGGADLTNVDKNLVNIDEQIKKRYLDYMNNGTDEIWNNWEKVSAADLTEATLNNTVQAPMNIDLEGNTEQEQLTGKNLFSGDYSQFDNVGGTGTNYNYFKLPDENKRYTLSMTAKNDFTPTQSTYIGFTGNGGNASNGYDWLIAGHIGTVTKGTKLSLTARENFKYLSLYEKRASVLELFTNNFDIQLEEGTTATDYEPYCGRNTSPKFTVINALLKM